MNRSIVVPIFVLTSLVAFVYLGGQLPGRNLKDHAPGQDSTSVANLEIEIQQRAADGAIHSLADTSALLTYLPDQISDFELVETRCGAFRGRKSAYVEARRIFANKQGVAIDISLGDYLRSLDELRYAYQQYEAEKGSPATPVPDCLSSIPYVAGYYAYAPPTMESRENIFEAGICYRYVLQIRIKGEVDASIPDRLCERIKGMEFASICLPVP